MEALACTMMVAVLSSRISFRRGVGSRLSSSIRTERLSLEMRNCRSNFSRFKRPSNNREKKPDTFKFYAWFRKHISHGPQSSLVGSTPAVLCPSAAKKRIWGCSAGSLLGPAGNGKRWSYSSCSPDKKWPRRPVGKKYHH